MTKDNKRNVMAYIFRRLDDNAVVLLHMTHDEWMARIESRPESRDWCITCDDGRVAHFCSGETEKVRYGKFNHTPGNWPMVSTAAGVAASQVAELTKYDREHGVPTEYTPDGDPIFTGKEHRRKHCQLHGMFDRNAGYGDPSPVNR